MLASWFDGSGRKESKEVILNRGCHTGYVLGAEKIYTSKGDSEVYGADDDVDTEGIPAIRLDEVF